MSKHPAWALLVVIIAFLTACSASAQVAVSDLQPLADGDAEAVVAADGEPADGEPVDSEPVEGGPVEGEADESTTGEGDLAEVFANVARSIVFIDTPDGTGSGVVIEGGWILTNAHNVDRYETVRIGASDGSDLGDHQVHGVDWLVDLALVGPIDDPAVDELARSSSAEARIGDPVLLIGYPDESNVAPTPSLTTGIVARLREAALGDIRLIQTDATIAGGQSGGALLDVEGRLLGISGLQFGEGEFGLAVESDSLWPRVDVLIENPTPTLPTDTPIPTDTAEIGSLRNYGAVVEVDESGEINVLVIGQADVWLEIQTLGGTRLFDEPGDRDFFNPTDQDVFREFFIDDLLEGGEELNATIDPGTYQLVVGSFSGEAVEITINSDNGLQPFLDLEEGATLPIGELVEGNIDFTGDSDRWRLDLVADEPITITSDGIADPVVVVRFADEVVATSDDEGIGVFGTGAQLTFTPEETGTYEVEVATFDPTRWSYLIFVE